MPTRTDQLTIHKVAPKHLDLDVRWVKPEKYHLTLKFLGNDVQERDIAGHLEQVEAWRTAFPISCNKLTLSGFPSANRARVLVLLLHSEGRLEALRPQQRSFLPHITIGYARRRKVELETFSRDIEFVLPPPCLFESKNGTYKVLTPGAR